MYLNSCTKECIQLAQSDLTARLLSCCWLSNCGTNQNCTYSFDVFLVPSLKDALKNISSSKWENVCLEEYGNITEYLAKNQKNEYNQHWNENVRKIKSAYLPPILEKISAAPNYLGFSNEFLVDIRFNLLAIFMSDMYSTFYSDEFFNKLLEVYLSGHLPCGWHGKYPSGELMVF